MYSHEFSPTLIKNVLITNRKLWMFINFEIRINIFYKKIVYGKVV